MRHLATTLLSSFLVAACAQRPTPNALAPLGDASFTPQVGQPAERDLLVVFTPQPSYAEVVIQSRGRSQLLVAEGEGGAAARHRFLKPAQLTPAVSGTSVPEQCRWGMEPDGSLDASGHQVYRKAIICNTSGTTASRQPTQLSAFAIAIASSDPISEQELALAAATKPDRDPQLTARRILERLTSNDPNARWSATVRQMSY
jgi:hypothetical protein